MRAGAKDRLIDIQVKSSAKGPTGEMVETWADVRTGIHAQKMEGPKVIERYAANQLTASVDMIFRVGYWPSYDLVKPGTHRIVFEGRALNVLGAFEIGRKKGVEIAVTGRTE